MMLSEQEAVTRILERARLLAITEHVDIRQANGRVCAGDIVADSDVPNTDNSAMDGYACASNDISAGSSLPISQRVAAGDSPSPLAAHTIARIFTGATLPPGADCVVPQEQCDATDTGIVFKGTARRGQHVRLRGEDIAQGDTVLRRGDLIGPAQIGLLAALGLRELAVYRPLRIALLSTGDELHEPGTPLLPGQRYNTNQYAIAAAAERLGFSVSYSSLVSDNVDDTCQALLRAQATADVIISTGGVSVGEEDHVKTALKTLGDIYLWKIAIKPGKPLVFGDVRGTPFIGLPGNPVSAMVTFLLIARPFLLLCQGRRQQQAAVFQVKAEFSWQTQLRCEYLRGRLHNRDGHTCVQLYPSQDSGIQSSLSNSDGLVRIEQQTTVNKGDWVDFIPYASLYY